MITAPDQRKVRLIEVAESGNVAIHMRPERWNTFDFRRSLDG